MENEHFKNLSSVIANCGHPSFWPLLHGMLCDTVPHEMMGVFLYRGSAPPVRLYDSRGGTMRDDVHVILAQVGYLISPYYNKLIKPRAAASFYHLSEVAPDNFTESEYFHAYYAKKAVRDEGMYHVPLAEGVTVVVMIERTDRMPCFDHGEAEALRGASSVVSALVANHFRLLPPTETHGLRSAANARIGFRNVAERFGAEILSNREREVAMLILRGHSTKSAARELGIAPETERVHRRRLYTKLGISSHSELFWLFFESSDHFDPSSRNDPLASYLRQRISAHPATTMPV